MELLNLRERYPFKCLCGYEVEIAPSMFMSCFQENIGGVHCPGCKKHIMVALDESNEKIIPLGDTPEAIKGGPLPEACYRTATPEEEEIINQRKLKKS